MNKERSMQTSPTLLEYLPNELFVEIFSYMNSVDTIFSFLNLNYRFQCLLLENCQFFDFKSISKTKFDFILQQHNIQRCKSLQLSNDDDTPGQIHYFCESYSFVNLCSHLQSLSILKMEAIYGYTFLLEQLQLLTNLKSLTMESVCGEIMPKFNLPKLKRLVLKSCPNTKWIESFSQLEIVEYTITDCCSYRNVPTWPLGLKRLKIIFETDDDLLLIQKSLTHLSQLITLEIYQKERGRLYPNGYLWEELIRSSLPLLKHFRFYFQFIYVRNTFNADQQIVTPFSTPFYIHEKNWFIRCDVCQTPKPWATIYTLPFAFDRFLLLPKSSNKSILTYSNDHYNMSNKNIYKNVKTLILEEKHLIPDEDLNKSQINNLIIQCHLNLIDWIHILTKLRHLEITSGARFLLKSFRLLLDNTPHLYSLSVEKSILRILTQNWTNGFICDHLSKKIRSLKLYSTMKQSHCLSRNELQQIIRIFTWKCQHLSLSVQSPNNTITLILQKMSQLQSLHVNINEKPYTSIDMIWLEKQQTKYNHSNSIIVNDGYDHYLWLG